MKKIYFLLSFCALISIANAQPADKIITAAEVERIERVLSSDSLQGRGNFTPGIEKAGDFIAAEFKKSGLQYFMGLNNYRQQFSISRMKQISAEGKFNDQPLTEKNIIALTTDTALSLNHNSGYQKIIISKDSDFKTEALKHLKSDKNLLVIIDTSFSAIFPALGRYTQESLPKKISVIFVLSSTDPAAYSLDIKKELKEQMISNIVGVLPGKSKKDEYVIFSAHYDHMGIGRPNAKGDSIYNGANDNASGTTAVILLAKYFSQLKNNERTLIFAGFTAEELGGFGSKYFSKQLNPGKIAAMFNIEMIGTESKWGTNSAYVTGYEKSNFGKILQSNLLNSKFRFEPDPYPKQDLFLRSDNATLAALGVPAHTISTSKMDVAPNNEPNYHRPSDEIGTLDMNNMAEIIKAIALSSVTIVNGKDTPSRVEKK